MFAWKHYGTVTLEFSRPDMNPSCVYQEGTEFTADLNKELFTKMLEGS